MIKEDSKKILVSGWEKRLLHLQNIAFVSSDNLTSLKDFIQSLLTQQRTELLEEILEENFCDLDGTYDYDGIAETVIKLAKKL